MQFVAKAKYEIIYKRVWSPFNLQMKVLGPQAHNFSACVTRVKTNMVGDRRSKKQGKRLRENARLRPLVLKDGRGSKAGVSPVTTSWVIEHDLLHLEPITLFLTTSWNTSAHFLFPSNPKDHVSHISNSFRLSFHRFDFLLISDFHL